MGEFTRKVQNGQIPGPLRRQFTRSNWSATFQSFADPDDGDQNLHAAALAIHEKLENIRSALNRSTSAALSATTRLRALVATVNHHFLVARSKSQAAMSEFVDLRASQQPEGFWAEEYASVRIELPGGFQFTPDEIVESLVDGVEIPVRFTLAQSPNLAGNPQMDQVEWGASLLELNLGILYRHAEDVWEDCLWNDYKLLDSGRSKVFIPDNLDVKRAYILGLARRFSLSIGFTAMATKIHRSLVYESRIPQMREVRSITRQGRRQVIATFTPPLPSDSQEQFLVKSILACEPYYAELLNEPQTVLSGLSVRHLLHAWNAISRAASLLMRQVEEAHAARLEERIESGARLSDYVPILQLEALIQAVASVVGVNRAKSKRLIGFLTFTGEAGQEIWSQPLIPVGSTNLSPVLIATEAPNLRRLVDVWLRQLSVDLARRGPAFEAYLRNKVEEGIRRSEILSTRAWSIRDGYTFRPTNGREEEIDLILIIGSTVIVAEAKCILEPTDSKGIATHRKIVLGASAQAKRKSEALRTNQTEFIADVRKFGIDLPHGFSVFPLVIVSTATHVGVPADDVPVIDEYILGRFLDGELEDVAIRGGDLAVQKTIKTLFYSDAIDAEKRISGYFAEPPQMERLKAGYGVRVIPLHAIDDHDWSGEILTSECVPTNIPLTAQGIPDTP